MYESTEFRTHRPHISVEFINPTIPREHIIKSNSDSPHIHPSSALPFRYLGWVVDIFRFFIYITLPTLDSCSASSCWLAGWRSSYATPVVCLLVGHWIYELACYHFWSTRAPPIPTIWWERSDLQQITLTQPVRWCDGAYARKFAFAQQIVVVALAGFTIRSLTTTTTWELCVAATTESCSFPQLLEQIS